VEVSERTCFCRHIPIPSLLGRLREILERLPIAIPVPDPQPGPDPAPFDARLLHAGACAIQ
jgi:hypothetical protein